MCMCVCLCVSFRNFCYLCGASLPYPSTPARNRIILLGWLSVQSMLLHPIFGLHGTWPSFFSYAETKDYSSQAYSSIHLLELTIISKLLL